MRLIIRGIVLAVAVQGLDAQRPTRLEVTSPLQGAYVSGQVRIEARLVPLAAEREIIRVSMSADGKEVCRLERRPYSCAWNAGPAIRKHQIRVVVELVGGQKLVKHVITRGVDVSESTGVSAVKVTATVKDRGGRFVSGLAPRDFTVYEDKTRQAITGFAAEKADVTVGLAIDTSGSMARALAGVKRQATLFLGLLPARWPTPVLAFDNSVFVIAPPGMSHEDRDRNIGLLEPWGGTALYNAILRTLAEVEGGEGRKAVVVFTDGDDRNSTVDPAEVRRAIESSDAVVYFVASGQAARNVAMMKFVGELAEISGGRVLRATTEEELTQAFTEVREEIRNQYLLTYVPAKLEKPGTWRPLSVEVACPGCRVRARTGYIVVAK